MTIEELLIKLISFKTVSGNIEEVNKAFNFIKSYLGKDFYYKTFTYNDFSSLLISNTKSMTDFDILFNGHIDVVTADDKDFNAYIKDDKLYGRGSIDMKGQIATILNMFKNTNTKKHIGFLINSDEEIGGHNGAEAICNNKDVNAKIVIIPDAGEDFTFVDSEKALLQLDLVTTGLSAHSSMLNQGTNAVIKTIDCFKDICEHFNLDPNCPINDTISVNYSKINAGDLYNKVPDIATWALDIRYLGLKFKDVERAISKICKRHNTIYSIHSFREDFKCDLKNSEVVKFIHACESFLGHPLKHINENGASDIGYFTSAGIPAVSINPVGYNLHSENEHVIISSLYKYKEMLCTYLDS